MRDILVPFLATVLVAVVYIWLWNLRNFHPKSMRALLPVRWFASAYSFTVGLAMGYFVAFPRSDDFLDPLMGLLVPGSLVVGWLASWAAVRAQCREPITADDDASSLSMVALARSCMLRFLASASASALVFLGIQSTWNPVQ